jgi:hypothetical protein
MDRKSVQWPVGMNTETVARSDARWRLPVALIVALAAAACSLTWGWQRPIPSDLYNVWAASRALWAGLNPYEAVGPGGVYPWEFALFYPMPAIVALLPIAWLPSLWADAVFVALATGACAWLIVREGRVAPLVWMLPSFAYLNAVERAQWSPAILASVLLPSLGWLAAAKPSIAAAIWLAYPSRRVLLLAAGFTIAVTLIMPWWPGEWIAALRGPTSGHLRSLILFPGGLVLLAALWKWRDPSARLLLAMACVPQTTHLYEAVPLFLIPRTHREGQILCALTIAAKLLWSVQRPYPDNVTSGIVQGHWMVWLLYWPCLVMVLRRQPSGAPDHAEDRRDGQAEQRPLRPAHESTLP